MQEILISARALAMQTLKVGLQGKSYKQAVDQSQWFTQERLGEYQNELLGKLGGVLREVDFYRPYVKGIGTLTTETLGAMPYVDKNTVREHGDRFMNGAYKGPRVSGGTSGTTGSPLTLYKSYTELRWENAFVNRQFQWAGYKLGERRAWIRGDMLIASDQDKPPFWRQNYAQNMLMMSSYHLSIQHAESYIRELEEFNPTLIQAYPSSIAFLAKYLEQAGREYKGDALRAILTSSETLLEEDRERIKRVFDSNVFDWYGSYERVAAIGSCEHGRYHLMSDYSFVEFEPVGNDKYEIVGTTFFNHLMPLVRYRSGDLVALSSESDCPCGRKFPMIDQIFGREDESIQTPSGRSINRLDHVFKYASGIVEAQIVQNEPDSIDINIVPAEGFSPRDEAGIRQEFSARVGAELAINVNKVIAIPRTKNGKLKSVICNLPK